MSDVVVRIAGTGSFLPGDPIPNDRLEFVLGPLDSAPDVVRRFVETIGPRMLERGGITTRHLAIDPMTGDLTHDHCGLAEPAALRASSLQFDTRYALSGAHERLGAAHHRSCGGEL